MLVNRGFFKEWPILHEFSLPAVLAGVMVGPATWMCNTFLVNREGGYAEMGIFNAANQWRMAILFLPGVVGSVVLPILSNLQGVDDRPRYNKLLWYNVLLVGFVSLSAALIISLFAPFIMRSYGTGFESGQAVMIWLCFSSVLSSICGVLGYSITSYGRMWWGTLLNFIWCIVLVGTAWIFISRGALGLALSNFIAYGIHLLTVSLYASYFLIDWKKKELTNVNSIC
jgi:O-antigen/teichoic acid export membrane protein